MESSNDKSDNGISTIPIMMLVILQAMQAHTAIPMWHLLSVNAMRACQGKICQSALQDLPKRAFWTLFNSQQDNALIALCGFDHIALSNLLAVFQDLFHSYRPLKAGGLIQKIKLSNANWGQSRLLCATSCLALYLAWTQSQGKQSILGLIFGVTTHHVSLWTCFACCLLIKELMTNKCAVVQMPSGQEVAEFKDSISAKYPSLQHVCGAVHGLKL